jgi:acyl carrier protein
VVAEWHRVAADEPVAAPAAPTAPRRARPRRDAARVAPASNGRHAAAGGKSTSNGRHAATRDAVASNGSHAPARGAAASNGHHAPAPEPTLEATTAIVLDVVRSIGKDRTVGLELDSSIAEMGLDSLERMEIVAALETRFGGRFPEPVIAEMYTCREVIDAVQKHLVNGDHPRRAERTGEIPPEHYRFERYPEYIKLKKTSRCWRRPGWGTPSSRCTDASPAIRP